jgi:hypothetical protein
MELVRLVIMCINKTCSELYKSKYLSNAVPI